MDALKPVHEELLGHDADNFPFGRQSNDSGRLQNTFDILIADLPVFIGDGYNSMAGLKRNMVAGNPYEYVRNLDTHHTLGMVHCTPDGFYSLVDIDNGTFPDSLGFA
ncbi:hypothetical protein D3C81_1942230 [compost metagenome]